jgi:hypothetical protein
LEVFTKKKHICPNRSNKSSGSTTTTTAYNNSRRRINSTIRFTKPHYYNPARKRTPYASSFAASKPKISNPFELLQGSIGVIQKKYEILSDIVIEVSGCVHGSQR